VTEQDRLQVALIRRTEDDVQLTAHLILPSTEWDEPLHQEQVGRSSGLATEPVGPVVALGQKERSRVRVSGRVEDLQAHPSWCGLAARCTADLHRGRRRRANSSQSIVELLRPLGLTTRTSPRTTSEPASLTPQLGRPRCRGGFVDAAVRFLINAQLPPALARLLHVRDHVAERVNDVGRGEPPDRDLWRYPFSMGGSS
jgi:hypothetical protein